MAGIIYELLEVLEEQKECYEGLYTLAEYKEQALVEKQLEVLTQIVAKEEEFVGRVNLLNRKRESLVKDIGIVTGLDSKTLTVTTIIEKLGKDNPVSSQLEVLKHDLLDIMKKVKKQNTLNETLIKQSLEIIDFSVNAISAMQGFAHTGSYDQPGKGVNMQRQQSLFDKKQ